MSAGPNGIEWNARRRRSVNNMNPPASGCGLGNIVSSLYGGLLIPPSMTWYVSKDGSDANGGTSWDDALLTIAAARAKHYATINWSRTPWWKYHRGRIFIAPGEYAENLIPGYQLDYIGTGILGTDTATEIHPASGAAVGGASGATFCTGLGLGLFNLRLETETAHPVVHFGVCNNTQIAGCEIVKGIAGLATTGIAIGNGSHVQIVGNRFISGVANFATGINVDHAVYAVATADKYFHACLVRDNHIFAATTGINIDEHNVASGALIQGNFIGGAALAKGIDDNNGNSWCVENFISATDAIEHANSATQCIGNSVINNGTGAKEAANT